MSTVVALTLGAAAPAPGTSRPQLEHATLELYEPVPAGSGSKPGASRGCVDFQFNPKELTIQKSAKWERKPARGAGKSGPPQFSGAEPCKLSLEMFFDASGTHDSSVVAAVEQLLGCCVPTTQSLGNKKATPPLVVLHWGAITAFPAFVTQVSAKYTLFTPGGIPIRAVCTVALEEMPADVVGQNPTSGGWEVNRAHVMVAGDSLASVAYAEYGDPTMWRAMATYNDIDDPLRTGPGTRLLVPVPDDLIDADG